MIFRWKKGDASASPFLFFHTLVMKLRHFAATIIEEKGGDPVRILLADDEVEITRALKIMLERCQYTVDTVSNGLDALDDLENTEYDAVVLDIMMPGMDGLSVLKRMRARGDATPTLLLTARGTVEDRVEGLDAGADDYLPKPFSSTEFLARVRALLRRRPAYVSEQLRVGDLMLDTASCLLSCGGASVRLGAKEFQMMELLMRNPGVILSAQTFMERIWGFESEAEINVVWVNIAYLRKKLAQLDSGAAIRSVRGVGYTLEASC